MALHFGCPIPHDQAGHWQVFGPDGAPMSVPAGTGSVDPHLAGRSPRALSPDGALVLLASDREPHWVVPFDRLSGYLRSEVALDPSPVDLAPRVAPVDWR